MGSKSENTVGVSLKTAFLARLVKEWPTLTQAQQEAFHGLFYTPIHAPVPVLTRIFLYVSTEEIESRIPLGTAILDQKKDMAEIGLPPVCRYGACDYACNC